MVYVGVHAACVRNTLHHVRLAFGYQNLPFVLLMAKLVEMSCEFYEECALRAVLYVHNFMTASSLEIIAFSSQLRAGSLGFLQFLLASNSE